MKHQKNSESGFSFIEILVSLALFSIVMLVAIGALLSIIDANRKAQTLALTMNNLDFALDRLFREIATGEDYYCIEVGTDIEGEAYALPTGQNDCALDGGPGIVVTNDQGYRVQYEVYAGQLWRNLEGGGWTPVTAQEVVIDEMLFYVDGAEDGDDNVQPHVNVLVKGRADAPRLTSSEFNVQTQVVQRVLDR